MKNHVISFLVGLIFALGLGISGMLQPSKVMGFLDVAGAWDPSLIFVMVGGIAVNTLAYRLVVLKREAPCFAARFLVPTRKDIDAPLVVGAILFGIGWGLGGYCPGPGIVSLLSGAMPAVTFVGSMLAGMTLFALVEPILVKK